MKHLASPLFALALVTTGCAEAPDVDTSAQGLMIPQGVTLWTSRGNVIPLCWLEPGNDDAKALVRDAIARTWAAAAPLTVVWREGCPASGQEPWVRVMLTRVDSLANAGGRAALGTAALSWPTDPVWCPKLGGGWERCRAVDLAIPRNLSSLPSRRYAEYLAIHEFGHLLGFGHEQDRFDAPPCTEAFHEPSSFVGPYDPASVMNDCTTRPNRLSEGDRTGVQEIYGRRADRTDALADLNGDGLAEPIATNADATYALTSTGFGFTGWRVLTSAFYGQRATAYADLDADGDADAIAVNDNAVFVLRSNGSTLTGWAMWTNDAFYGARRTLVGDVDGDGRADLVAINYDTTCLRRSSGAGFVDHGCLGSYSYGVVQTDLADVDGDGRADVIANHGADGLWVRRARDPNGGFGPGFAIDLEAWTIDDGPFERATFTADRVLAFGDVDGDGRADALAVRFDGIYVRRSTGDAFLPEQRWTDAPALGQRATRFADVTGDGRVDVVLIDHDADRVLVSTGDGFAPFGVPWTTGPFYTL